MDIINLEDVEQFFRNQPLYPMATSVKDIKKNLMTYTFHWLNYEDDILIVDYMIGNKVEEGQKEYPLQEFLTWCEENCTCKEDYMSVDLDKDDVEKPFFDVYLYIDGNEKALAMEFFNSHK